MRANTVIKGRSARLGLLVGALALVVWGTTLLTSPQASPVLSQNSAPSLQTADGGGGKPNG